MMMAALAANWIRANRRACMSGLRFIETPRFTPASVRPDRGLPDNSWGSVGVSSGGHAHGRWLLLETSPGAASVNGDPGDAPRREKPPSGQRLANGLQEDARGVGLAQDQREHAVGRERRHGVAAVAR